MINSSLVMTFELKKPFSNFGMPFCNIVRGFDDLKIIITNTKIANQSNLI